MISYARVFFVLVLLLVLQARLAHAQFDVQAPLTLTRIVVHVEDGVIDRRFMPDLEERLRAMFVAPVDVLNNTVEGSLLHKSSSGHVDASLLLNALAASIDWQLYAGAYHVLLIAQDIRLAPDSFNFLRTSAYFATILARLTSLAINDFLAILISFACYAMS